MELLSYSLEGDSSLEASADGGMGTSTVSHGFGVEPSVALQSFSAISASCCEILLWDGCAAGGLG